MPINRWHTSSRHAVIFGALTIGLATTPLAAQASAKAQKNVRITFLAGFTTVQNVGAREFADIARRDVIKQGVIPGPRMFTAFVGSVNQRRVSSLSLAWRPPCRTTCPGEGDLPR